MTTFADWRDLPAPIQAHLDALEDFICDVDGKMLCTERDEHTLIDEGTVDAENAVKAINDLIKYLRACQPK